MNDDVSGGLGILCVKLFALLSAFACLCACLFVCLFIFIFFYLYTINT